MKFINDKHETFVNLRCERGSSSTAVQEEYTVGQKITNDEPIHKNETENPLSR